jgi:hypothetical protein
MACAQADQLTNSATERRTVGLVLSFPIDRLGHLIIVGILDIMHIREFLASKEHRDPDGR